MFDLKEEFKLILLLIVNELEHNILKQMDLELFVDF